MVPWREIWRIINSCGTSTCYDSAVVKVRDSARFNALPLSKQQSINSRIENEQRSAFIKCYKKIETLDDVRERSSRLVPLVLNNYKTGQSVTAAVRDAIANFPTVSGMPGQDPATMNLVTPNLYLSPHEAAAVYGQKGLPETILNKKGKSPLLNGVRIKNPKLTPEQHDIIRDDMVKNSLANKLVEGIIQALIYGGGLMFPMFKHDSPVTMHLPMEALLKYGVVGKGCLDYWVVLDRWNAVHIPNWNPTARDFLYPLQYYIPFLGTHVSGSRCARIVTAPQYGYWAVLMTLGWGISDIPGWIEPVFNYRNVMSAIPTMIQQMSILVRTINVDSYMATEGQDVLHHVDFESTLKVREASVHNPVNIDVIGDIKALQRDFAEVPNLVRLIRQDVGACANIPEELLFSSERGAFSSGDPTEGAQEKQWESIKYIHRDVAAQLKNIVMLEVVNALGKDRDVLSALPYTTIEFDNPSVANVESKSVIGKNVGEMLFDNTGSGVPLDISFRIAQAYGGEEFLVSSDILKDLQKRQTELDAREKEKHEKEMEKLDAEVELIKEQTAHVGDVGVGSAGSVSRRSSSGYTRLEQHKKERTRGTAARREGLQKAAGKKLV